MNTFHSVNPLCTSHIKLTSYQTFPSLGNMSAFHVDLSAFSHRCLLCHQGYPQLYLQFLLWLWFWLSSSTSDAVLGAAMIARSTVPAAAAASLFLLVFSCATGWRTGQEWRLPRIRRSWNRSGGQEPQERLRACWGCHLLFFVVIVLNSRVLALQLGDVDCLLPGMLLLLLLLGRELGEGWVRKKGWEGLKVVWGAPELVRTNAVCLVVLMMPLG